MLPDKGETGERVGPGDKQPNPLIPCEPKLTPPRLLRHSQGGLGLEAQRTEITMSSSRCRGRRCRPRANCSECSRHAGAGRACATIDAGAGAGRCGGGCELLKHVHGFLQMRDDRRPPLTPGRPRVYLLLSEPTRRCPIGHVPLGIDLQVSQQADFQRPRRPAPPPPAPGRGTPPKGRQVSAGRG